MAKVVVIGLDGLCPDLVQSWANELPSLWTVMDQGIHGRAQSNVPPTTVHAWGCVLAGRDSGQFGLWDSTCRQGFSYDELEISKSTQDAASESLYTVLASNARRAAFVNVPAIYPSLQMPSGYCVSSSASPRSTRSDFVHHRALEKEIASIVGEYMEDVSEDEKILPEEQAPQLIRRIYRSDQQRFRLLEYFSQNKDYDLVFGVVTGADRLSHRFCRYFDKSHVRYRPHPVLSGVLKEYYRFCDKNIGEIVDGIGPDTDLVVLSSYATKRLEGRVNLNQWLIQEGYLRLCRRPSRPTFLASTDVDWSRTKAWSMGFSGKIYLNVAGREKEGVVKSKEQNTVLDELILRLRHIRDKDGRVLGTKTFKTKDNWTTEAAGDGPDLFVHFDNYAWSTSEIIGCDSIYSYDLPGRQDDATHIPCGFLAFYGPGVPKGGKLSRATLIDIAPSVLKLMGVEVPQSMEGRPLIAKEDDLGVKESEEGLKDRLRKLGYFTMQGDVTEE